AGARANTAPAAAAGARANTAPAAAAGDRGVVAFPQVLLTRSGKTTSRSYGAERDEEGSQPVSEPTIATRTIDDPSPAVGPRRSSTEPSSRGGEGDPDAPSPASAVPATALPVALRLGGRGAESVRRWVEGVLGWQPIDAA